MNIICVDRSSFALRNLLRETQHIMPEAAVQGCKSPDEAVTVAEREGCDILLTDIDLDSRRTDGFMLAEKIKALNPYVNIIFVTEHTEGKYGCAAFQLRASGYITKPYKTSELAREFAHLRYAVV